jgi:hypothetical protein
MTTQQLRSYLDLRPFEPFIIHVADQRAFGVWHPEAAVLSASGRTITLLNQDRLLEIIDMLLVTSVRPASEVERRARIALGR